jgi:hypothetical protein
MEPEHSGSSSQGRSAQLPGGLWLLASASLTIRDAEIFKDHANAGVYTGYLLIRDCNGYGNIGSVMGCLRCIEGGVFVQSIASRLLAGVAALLLATGAAHAAEKVDWGKDCGPNNERCDPSDAEDNN